MGEVGCKLLERNELAVIKASSGIRVSLKLAISLFSKTCSLR